MSFCVFGNFAANKLDNDNKRVIEMEHRLTKFGKTLIPVITTLGQWGDKHEEYLRHVILKQEESVVTL